MLEGGVEGGNKIKLPLATRLAENVNTSHLFSIKQVEGTNAQIPIFSGGNYDSIAGNLLKLKEENEDLYTDLHIFNILNGFIPLYNFIKLDPNEIDRILREKFKINGWKELMDRRSRSIIPNNVLTNFAQNNKSVKKYQTLVNFVLNPVVDVTLTKTESIEGENSEVDGTEAELTEKQITALQFKEKNPYNKTYLDLSKSYLVLPFPLFKEDFTMVEVAELEDASDVLEEKLKESKSKNTGSNQSVSNLKEESKSTTIQENVVSINNDLDELDMFIETNGILKDIDSYLEESVSDNTNISVKDYEEDIRKEKDKIIQKELSERLILKSFGLSDEDIDRINKCK